MEAAAQWWDLGALRTEHLAFQASLSTLPPEPFAAYVHLLTSAMERGETLRRHQAGATLIRTANAAPDGPAADAGPARFLPPIPQSHVALIVVP